MKDNRHYFYVVLIALILVLGIYYIGISEANNIISHFNFLRETDGLSPEKRGLFGDSTGFINTLFSSLAFAGVILTLYWQIKENGKNKKEDHRKQFEDVFFHMTDNFETIISGLKVEVVDPFDNIRRLQQWTTLDNDNRTQYKEGREVFKYLYGEMMIDQTSLTGAIQINGIKGYEGFVQGYLDHYFRYFYRILRYIDDNKLIDDEQKYRYACVLRAHLSSYELLIMHYNGLSSVGYAKLKPLLEKYSMLNNIRFDLLVNQSKQSERIFFGENVYYQDQAFQHERKSTKKELRELWYRVLWTAIITLVIVPFVLPSWNDVIIDDLVVKLPSDSFTFFLVLLSFALYHVWRRWDKDEQLISQIQSIKNEPIEKKEELEMLILKRCQALIPVSVIIIAGCLMLLISDYYLTGGLAFCDFLVCFVPIVYEIYAMICVAVRVQDAYYLRNVKLFAN
jgi:hypothetical protein